MEISVKTVFFPLNPKVIIKLFPFRFLFKERSLHYYLAAKAVLLIFCGFQNLVMFLYNLHNLTFTDNDWEPKGRRVSPES